MRRTTYCRYRVTVQLPALQWRDEIASVAMDRAKFLSRGAGTFSTEYRALDRSVR